MKLFLIWNYSSVVMKLLLMLPTPPVMFPQLAHFKSYNQPFYFILFFYMKKGKIYLNIYIPHYNRPSISGIYRFNQPWIKNIRKKMITLLLMSTMQLGLWWLCLYWTCTDFFIVIIPLIQCNSYLRCTYIVVGIVYNLEMT